VVKAGFHDTLRTVIYTGRPMRVLKTQFNEELNSKQDEINEMINKVPLIPCDARSILGCRGFFALVFCFLLLSFVLFSLLIVFSLIVCCINS
jgi:hypothetical protein